MAIPSAERQELFAKAEQLLTKDEIAAIVQRMVREQWAESRFLEAVQKAVEEKQAQEAKQG